MSENTNRLFALIVVGKEVKGRPGGLVSTKRGQRFWVLRGDFGPTSRQESEIGEQPPGDVLTFESAERARSFADGWEGHPWWCVPSGECEVVTVVPKTKVVPDGYARA